MPLEGLAATTSKDNYEQDLVYYGQLAWFGPRCTGRPEQSTKERIVMSNVDELVAPSAIEVGEGSTTDADSATFDEQGARACPNCCTNWPCAYRRNRKFKPCAFG